MAANSSPIIILILKNDDGNVSYKSFSPAHYSPPQDDALDYDVDFQTFQERVYDYIGYDNNVLFNITNFGRLLEVHSRHITTPIEQRGNTIWFSTYQNSHTDYLCIHRPSPIHFSQDNAVAYQNMQPELVHTSCEHIIL